MMENVAVVSDQRHSYLGWGAVMGGALIGAASCFLLMAFGGAVGLSIVSPWTGHNPTPGTLGFLAAAWFLIVAVCSAFAGAYVTGRMRKGWDDLSLEDARSRDGFHGLVVWAVSIIMFVVLGMAAAGTAALGSANDRPDADEWAGESYVLDTLFRGTPTASNRAVFWERRDEAARILARSVGPDPMSTGDRSYLAQLVMADANVSRDEADQRVDNAIIAVKKAADTSRKTGVLTGFLTVAGLLIAAAASWLGAVAGGQRQIKLIAR